MRGRKPTPDHIKELRGTDRPDRMNPDQPTAGVEALQFIPEELSEPARKYWKDVRVRLIESGMANNLDREALIILCEQWCTMLLATEEVRKYGMVRPSAKNADVYVRNPYITIMNQTSDRVMKILSEFGMTPTSRQRLKVESADPRAGKTGDFAGY